MVKDTSSAALETQSYRATAFLATIEDCAAAGLVGSSGGGGCCERTNPRDKERELDADGVVGNDKELSVVAALATDAVGRGSVRLKRVFEDGAAGLGSFSSAAAALKSTIVVDREFMGLDA